jgi:uncharacterized protein YoxC
MMTIAITTTAIAVCAVAVGLVWLSRKYSKLKRDYADIAEIVHGHNNDIRELYAAALTVDERINGLVEQLSSSREQISALATKISEFNQHSESENANHPYSLAIQKVRSGASVSELMQNSGLSQDEAALLIRLHGAKSHL